MPLSQKTWFGNSFKNYYFFNLLRTDEVNLAENMLWIKGLYMCGDLDEKVIC